MEKIIKNLWAKIYTKLYKIIKRGLNRANSNDNLDDIERPPLKSKEKKLKEDEKPVKN